MFVGHLAAALGAKRVEPRLPLAALVAAAFGLDLLWPVFLLTGIEVVRIDPGNTAFTPLDFVSYPWSHSLVFAMLWGALAGLVAARRLGAARTGVVLATLVVSHWVLDVVSHRPDLPVWPGGPVAGFGLWNSVPATFAGEGAMLVAGLALYMRAAPARDATGRWALAALVAVTAVIWISGPYSPPPPGVQAIAFVCLGLAVVFPLWAHWIERHRSA